MKKTQRSYNTITNLFPALSDGMHVFWWRNQGTFLYIKKPKKSVNKEKA